MKTAYIGRFQPFHLGHLADVKAALTFSDELVIAIGSSQELNTSENPFSFDERKEMINRSVPDHPVIAIPDIHDDTIWVDHVLGIIGKIDCVYTGNDHVAGLFAEKNIEVRRVEMVPAVSGSIIREKMIKQEAWEDLVPKEVSEYLHEISAQNRVSHIEKNPKV